MHRECIGVHRGRSPRSHLPAPPRSAQTRRNQAAPAFLPPFLPHQLPLPQIHHHRLPPPLEPLVEYLRRQFRPPVHPGSLPSGVYRGAKSSDRSGPSRSIELTDPCTPARRIVADIDDIVKKVRFPEWQHTTQGERLVQKELRRTLLKYKLHTDQTLFDRAYGYIRQYY